MEGTKPALVQESVMSDWIPWHKRSPENAEKARERNRDWKRRNSEKAKEIVRTWKSKNPGHNAEQNLARRRGLLEQGISKHFRPEILKIYAEARRISKESGVIYTVDHIYPIKHRICCGLHVPWNLQILTKEENDRKGNKLPRNKRVWKVT
jgi:hypothetical protein